MVDNVTNELLLEHLKRIQSDLLDLKSMRTETREGFASIRQHFAALNNDHTLLEYRLLALESEMERVRRRLDIKE